MKSWLLSLGSIALGGALLLAAGCTDEPKRYSITFKQDDCTDVVFTVDAGGTLTPPKPKDVTGYTVTWDRTSFENITENLVVNAVYTPNEYTITYVLEEGETLDEYTQTVTYDAQYELKTPIKYLYKFDGWYNNTTLVEQSGVWKIADDVTLTAHWSDNSYTVTFINLDGTTESFTLEKGEGLDLTKVPAVQTKPGYDTYWDVEDLSSISGTTTVTAQKSAKSFTVEYLLGPGETIEGETSETITFGSDYTLKTPTKDGTTFRYWKTEDGVIVPLSGKWTLPNDIELQAVWTEKVLITFIHSDGTTDEVEAMTGGSLTAEQIPTPKPVEGYDVYWSVTDFGCIEGAMTVEARKVPKTYTVTYSVPEGTTLEKPSTIVTYKDTYALETPVRYGYTFVCWKTADGAAVAKAGDEWAIVGDVTLTAEWADNYYKIQFIHADETIEIVKVENGDTLSADRVPACKQIAGYTVVWETTDFSTIRIVNAVKTANTYKISYQLEEGETIPETALKAVVYGQSYQLEDASNSDINQIFAGWVNAATGEKVPSRGVWTIVGDVELIPDWVDAENDFTQNH